MQRCTFCTVAKNRHWRRIPLQCGWHQHLQSLFWYLLSIGLSLGIFAENRGRKAIRTAKYHQENVSSLLPFCASRLKAQRRSGLDDTYMVVCRAPQSLGPMCARRTSSGTSGSLNRQTLYNPAALTVVSTFYHLVISCDLHCEKYLNSIPTSLNNLIDSIEGLIVPNFVK